MAVDPFAPHRQPGEPGSPRVLLVDDDVSTTSVLTARLRRAGFEVHRADHVERAAFLLAHLRFAVVVTDLNLSGGFDFSGLDLCQHVRRNHAGTRVVLLTGATTRLVETEARRLGLNAVLYKPCPAAQVVGLVRQLCEGARRLLFEALPPRPETLSRAARDLALAG